MVLTSVVPGCVVLEGTCGAGADGEGMFTGCEGACLETIVSGTF